ncbi:hypothetical protein [Polaromonas sp. CG_9.11]|uniref:hypothetical protein n=1 Tax=Polaromonas sp. CG_9.11 TaxID=2787730 RepID=UPI001E2D4941|nr:hypothetical protein [Polaromonas sp. CG_9.11]
MTDIKTYGMSERADHLDFDIRSQCVRPPLVRPHRHEYFQIQVSLQGDAEQNVAGTGRLFAGLASVSSCLVACLSMPIPKVRATPSSTWRSGSCGLAWMSIRWTLRRFYFPRHLNWRLSCFRNTSISVFRGTGLRRLKRCLNHWSARIPSDASARPKSCDACCCN